MKRQIPQLNKTGLSWEYLNELCLLDSQIQSYKIDGEDSLRQSLDIGEDKYIFENINPLKNYEECFKNCENIVNSQNKDNIDKINSCVKIINSNLEKKINNPDLLKQGIDKIYSIISGKKRI